ncbi:acetylglutamate kinase [Galbibacter pacificus]|uniref:Acetylglutamate kinase n=1 Tax=Galbibacter pacificus TaxID=2996052 RepID=A0ABT6FQ06_9FLAO|nr:acetylglutamate kinase [Galbibacter pacificus]MDG3582176.1 acetylglutamate kinase [Galbibacter pacificus]MDG3585348.1 acetylglutamate kinase [Galbibacter pacificus]
MKLSIVKIGGNLIEKETALEQVLENFSKIEGPKILVHGGGKMATQMAEKLGVETKMVDGRRITDQETLNIITMVYGGLVNKTIVAKLQAKNCNALGLSGADLNSIKSVKRPVKTHDFGFVGDITNVNTNMFSLLLNNTITPVCCAISHDGDGQLFNTNADTIASEIAIALANEFEAELYYCFEKKGVLRSIEDEDSVITDINTEIYQALIKENIIADGMLPKLHNCFHALEKNVHKVYIGSVDMLGNEKEIRTTITL